MLARMQGNFVPSGLHSSHNFRMLGRIFAHHKKSGVHLLFGQNLQQLLRIGWIGAIVKGQRDLLFCRAAMSEHGPIKAVAR